MSTPPDILIIFQHVLEKLEEGGVDYMVVGSIASILYGEPRMTRDMDIVIELKLGMVRKLTSLFSEKEYYLPPHEVILSEATQQGQFNLIHHESGLKIDFIVRKTLPHSIEEFKRRRKVPFTVGFSAWVASPEDVIIKKLSYYREGGSEKHLTDIRGILAQTNVEKAYLDDWVSKLGLEKQWGKV